MKPMLQTLIKQAKRLAGKQNSRLKNGRMEERSYTMERKKFRASLVALVAGLALSAGSAFAQTGVLTADPAAGKLIPYYSAAGDEATIIGIENVITQGNGVAAGDFFVFVHVVIHGTTSAEQMDFTLCLSPYDFGYVILQNAAMSAAQTADKTARAGKVSYLTVTSDNIATSGYVTLAVSAVGDSCTDTTPTAADGSTTYDALATWAVIQDVGSNAFATEVPTASATVNTATGNITCAAGTSNDCPGLMGINAIVTARFDVSSSVTSTTSIFTWLGSNGALVGTAFVRNVSAVIQCEDEAQISTQLALPLEINVSDPSTLTGIGQCTGQSRGVLRYALPDSGLAWSHISQAGATYRMNFLAYSGTANPNIP